MGTHRRRGLGDVVESTLKAVGVTPESVTKLFGSCGGCARRRAFLNKLSDWAESVIGCKKTQDEALEDLTKIDPRIKPDIPKPEDQQKEP